MGSSPWLWIPLALLLFAAALYALARFIIGDRPRDRRRCPKCWYDLAGIPDACPECGRKIRSQRELTRTRRHKRWAALALTLALLGAASLATPTVVTRGALALMPNGILITTVEHIAGTRLGNELRARHWRGELSQDSQRDLILRTARLLEASEDPSRLAFACGIISDAEIYGHRLSPLVGYPWMVPATECVDAERLARALAPLLDHEDRSVHEGASAALSNLAPHAAILVPKILLLRAAAPTDTGRGWGVIDAHFSAPFEPLRQTLANAILTPEPHAPLLAFAASLAALPAEPESLRTPLLDALADPDDEVAALAAWMLRTCYRSDDECRLRALATFDPTRAATAPILLSYALRGPLDEPTAAIIRDALTCEDEERRKMALLGLANRGKEAAAFIPDVQRLLGNPGAARTYAKIGGEPERAARTVLSSMSGEHYQGELRTLAGIGWLEPLVIDLMRMYLESQYPYARLEAAVSLLRCGPPEGFDRADLTRIAVEAALSEDPSVDSDYLHDAIRAGVTDLPALLASLESVENARVVPFIVSIGVLGSRAEIALPWLKERAGNSDRNIARNADHAIRRIVWCLEHGDPPSRDDWW